MKNKPLTKQQKQALKRHREHHTAAHMRHMTRLMGQGASFTESHKSAMKKVGK